MMRSAAREMVCRPEEQKRLTVIPGHGIRQTGCLCGDASDLHPLFAFGEGASEDDIFDFCGFQTRRTVERCSDDKSAQMFGAVIAQRATWGFANGVRTADTITASWGIRVSLLSATHLRQMFRVYEMS